MNDCYFCGKPVDEDDPRTYHEVKSWVNGPKLDGPKLRNQTGRIAHEHCVLNQVSGQAADQPELFEEEPILTDEPGKITKLTGPDSVHDAMRRCGKLAKKGTGWGICDRVLENGMCPNFRSHAEEL